MHFPPYNLSPVPPERQQGWWTNFSEGHRAVYEQLVKDYPGPGKLVIREAVAPAPKSYGGSLWVEPCPADWREWQALNNAVDATPFWGNLRKATNRPHHPIIMKTQIPISVSDPELHANRQAHLKPADDSAGVIVATFAGLLILVGGGLFCLFLILGLS